MDLLAHYDRDSGRKQTLKEHCEGTAKFCGEACSFVGLEHLGRLTGLIHDAGKATRAFQNYLLEGDTQKRGSINHSSCGARLITQEYPMDTTATGLTSQLIAAAVCGHHSGLPDCTSLSGEDELNNRVLPEKPIFYEEAADNFTSQCVSLQHIRQLFQTARDEVMEYYQRLLGFCDTL